MNDENTQWQAIEPTAPVTPHANPHVNPYEPNSDTTTPEPAYVRAYVAIPPPPPPPMPPQRKQKHAFVLLWVGLVIAILLVLAAGLFTLVRSYQTGQGQPTVVAQQTVVGQPTQVPSATGQLAPTTLPTSTAIPANTVNISDAAHVLNEAQVRSEASTLPNPINIYTTNTFTGDASAFKQRTYSHVTSANLVVIAIDTVNKHIAIVGGTRVPLSQSQYDNATQAFVTQYTNTNGDYTASIIASLRSLHSALGV